MDDFMDPFLSSPSWSNMNASARSSWVGAVASQTNSLLVDSMEAYGGDAKNSSVCMIPSSHIIGNVVAEDMGLNGHDDSSSIFANGNLKYLSNHELTNHTSHPSQHDNKHDSNLSLQGLIDSNSTACSIALPHGTLTMPNSIESNDSEPSTFPLHLGESHSISSVSAMWPSSYAGVSSFIGQGKLPGFGFQGAEADADMLRKTCVENGKYPHLSNLPTVALHDHDELHNSHVSTFTAGQQIKLASGGLQSHQEQNELHNLGLPSFAAGPQMTLNKTASVQDHQQLSQSIEGNTLKHHTNHSSGSQPQPASANSGACNGAAKPRVRARRGQATDPHSIAERLRREKIAERMKNLQELVPNSNKTDKASMLDEIIDYVKFLQLQVKVLSMSRLGAAGAVVPLITDVQTEGSGTLHLSSLGGGADLTEMQDNAAFEQEVVKLMESNVTTAMQYLQIKGLCLMPIALAAAISSQKGSTAAIPSDRRKPDMSHSVISQSSSQSLGDSNGCNGGVVKREEVRELNPKA